MAAGNKQVTAITNSNPSLGAQVARGAAMLTASRFLSRIIGFINTLILARLLVPEDFGLVAIGFTIMQLLQNVSDIGVAQAVVKYREDDRVQVDTLFTLSVLRGVLVASVLAIAAPFADNIFDDPRVTPLFFSVAAISFVAALINPRFYEFERDLQFSREAALTLVVKIISVIVSVGIAITFRSYWAIVLGYAAGVLVQLLGSYLLKPYWPRLSFGRVRKLIGFTGWLTGVSALVAMNNKTEVLILGRMLGTAPTGVYHMGEQVASMATMELATPIARAVYPGLSTLQDDPAEMRKAYLEGTAALAAIATPAAVGTAFVADDLVAVLLGESWTAAVPVLQVFAPVFGLVAIYMATQALAMAAGRTRQVFFRELIFFLIKTPIFIVATAFYGFTGALTAAAINGGLYVLLQGRLYSQLTGGSLLEPLFRARRSLFSIAAMAAYFLLLRSLIPGVGDMPVVLRLFVDVMAGGAIYVLAHFCIWKMSGQPDGIESACVEVLSKIVRKRGVVS